MENTMNKTLKTALIVFLALPTLSWVGCFCSLLLCTIGGILKIVSTVLDWLAVLGLSLAGKLAYGSGWLLAVEYNSLGSFVWFWLLTPIVAIPFVLHRFCRNSAD